MSQWRGLNPDHHGECHEAAIEMVQVFPELHPVCGEVLTCQGWLTHWWVQDASGAIYDPTATQFEGGPLGYRVPRKPYSNQLFDRLAWQPPAG